MQWQSDKQLSVYNSFPVQSLNISFGYAYHRRILYIFYIQQTMSAELGSGSPFEIAVSKILNTSTNRNSTDSKIRLSFWCCILTFIIACYSLSLGLQGRCPSTKYFNTNSPFNENKAFEILKTGTKISAHRYVGSKSNEVDMPRFLMNILKKFHSQIGNYTLEVSEQMSKGLSMNRVFLYRNIRNIALRVRDNRIMFEAHKPAILINCHYDSELDSPGAGDNFVNCAVMLEIIRVIDERKPTLTHDIIFLFNGAEERQLIGSHLFVSQHKWWRDVKAFVNLEAAGSGGRLMVFQVDKPWIVQLYAESANCPFGAVFGQEIFEANLIPSDTDYRIFKMAGDLAGIDMATVQNGYVYHTKYDEMNSISINCLKNSGSNLLNFALKLANSPYVTDPESDKQSALVYFDYLGLFMVYYSTMISYFLNLGSCAYIFVRFGCRVYFDKLVLKYDFLAVISHIVYMIFMFLLNYIIAFCMNLLNMKMSWYSNRLNAVGLYVLPILLLYFIYHKTLKFWPSDKIAESSHFESGKLLICILTLIATFTGFKTSYILMMWLLFPSIIESILNLIENKITFISESYRIACKFMLMYFIPLSYTFYLFSTIFEIFIPIMGRSPYGPEPDVFISLAVAVNFCLPALVFSGNVYVTQPKTLRCIRYSLIYVIIFYIFIITFSNFAFPFNSCADTPRKQRIYISHLNRIYYQDSLKLRHSDSGLAIAAEDQIQFHHLKQAMKELNGARQISNCHNASNTNCVIHPTKDIAYYIPRKPHSFCSDLKLTIVNKTELHSSIYNITISVAGPSNIKLDLKLTENLSIVQCSIPAVMLTNRYITLSYLYGTKPESPLTFWMLIKKSFTPSRGHRIVEYSIHGTYTDSGLGKSEALIKFLEELPNWVVSTSDHSCFKSDQFIL